jgi:hypothetical protein
MKKLRTMICLAGLSVVMVSCTTTSKTAKTADFDVATYNATVADLDVSDHRVSVTLNPVPADVNRGGISNVKKTVEAMALEQNGNADVLVNPEFTYTVERGFFSKKITSMTVTGRPAKYKNFRSLNDSVWANPTFRGIKTKLSTPKGVKITPLVGNKPELENNRNIENDKNEALRDGFTWGIELGCAYNIENEFFDKKKLIPTASILLGYHIDNNLYAGVGTEANYEREYEEDILFQPVFGNLRYYIGKTANTPFVDARVGYAFEHLFKISDVKMDGGLYYSFSIGYCFDKFDLSFYYSMQSFKFTDRYYGNEYYKNKINRIGLRIGYRL